VLAYRYQRWPHDRILVTIPDCREFFEPCWTDRGHLPISPNCVFDASFGDSASVADSGGET
jgi:hypothetical protein